MDFQKVYKEYLEYAIKRHKKQGYETIAKDFRARICPYFKDILVTKESVKNWYDCILNEHFSNKYNNKLYCTFCSFLNYSVEKGYLEFNYLHDLGNFPKHYEEKKTDFYTFKEFKQFIKGFTREELVYKEYFSFLFFTGCRPSEAMALKFSDLRGNYVSINKTILRHGKREFDTPKTRSSVRDILLDKNTLKRIKFLKSYYEKKYEKRGDYFIFGGEKPLSPTSIDRYKKNACNRVNIRPITTHQFRHSHATLLLHKGMLVNEVSRRLGHSSVNITLEVYTHTNYEQEKRVVHTLNSLRF